jgi:TPR repeat protein
VHECDRLAAHEVDKDAVAKPIEYRDINAEAVIRACTAAIRQYPDTSRFYTQLGSGQMKAGQRTKAFSSFTRAARMGSPQGMALLATMHKGGLGVPKNRAKALRLFEKAGRHGNVGGMLFAASMYYYGEGAPKNYKLAAKWYDAVAREGYAEGMYSLSNMLDHGEGVRRNPRKAADLMLRAYKKGHNSARFDLMGGFKLFSAGMRKEIQNILARKGHYFGPIDGEFGDDTKRALKAFAPQEN